MNFVIIDIHQNKCYSYYFDSYISYQGVYFNGDVFKSDFCIRHSMIDCCLYLIICPSHVVYNLFEEHSHIILFYLFCCFNSVIKDIYWQFLVLLIIVCSPCTGPEQVISCLCKYPGRF